MENSRKVNMDDRILVVRDPWLMQGCPGMVGVGGGGRGNLRNKSLGAAGCEVERRSFCHSMKYA